MKILGIDLAASQRKRTGLCLLGENLKAECFSLFSDKEILDFIKKEKPNLLAIDAPLFSSKKPFRKAERDLLDLGIRVLPLELPGMKRLNRRARRLKRLLGKKIKIIEVYPQATKEILGKNFRKFKIKILNKKLSQDEFDALVSALTGYFYLKRKFFAIGNKKEGEIILPSLKRKKILNCQIDLTKRIFQPRVETIFWLKKVIRALQKERKKMKILDIFCGSGLIGILILKEIKKSFVYFGDIDKEAIFETKINLKLNKIARSRYKVIKSNLFEKLKERGFDFIFANPPYVAKERMAEVQKSVKEKEPKISWYGDREGLKYIKKFLKGAKDFLKKGGSIFLEFDPFQKEKIEKIAKKEGFNKIKFFKDQFSKIRLAKITRVEN